MRVQILYVALLHVCVPIYNYAVKYVVCNLRFISTMRIHIPAHRFLKYTTAR